MSKKKNYSASEICKKVGISKNTLFRWEKEGIIPQAKKDWRGWRVFDDEDLNKVLKAKRGKEIINLGQKEKK